MTMQAMAMIREKQAEPASAYAGGVVPASCPVERNVYAPPSSGRIVGLIGTILVYAALLTGFFLLTYTSVAPHKASSTLTVFDVRPPASPPQTPPEEKDTPRPVRKKEQQPEPQQARPIDPPRLRISPVPLPEFVAVPKSADPGPKEPEAAVPKPLPVPPAPQISSNAADTWEGRVLAQLAKNRRYPRSALIWKQQGVPYVRIVMDRQGKVLSSRLERSSGFPDLDREAVALPKRASPLPKPPDDKPGDTLELVVPIEFLLRTS